MDFYTNACEQLESAPILRFKEFADPWKQIKLDEVAEINPRSTVPEQFEYVDLESVLGTELVSHRTESRDTAPSRAQRLAKEGDIFFQTVRPYQKNNFLFNLPFENFVFSTGYAQLRPRVNSPFLFAKLQEENFVSAVLEKCTGTSYPAINSADLSQIYIDIPLNAEEQAAIGTFFRFIDITITLYRHKLDLLRQLKKGYLQQMFPQPGESIPRVRFAGFTEKWEHNRFETLVQRLSKTSSDTALPMVEFDDIVSGYGLLNKDVYAKMDNKTGIKFNHGDILYGKLRPYLKNWLLTNFEGVAVGDFWVLRPNDTDSGFMFSLIQSEEFQAVANLSAGTKMPRADWKLVSNTAFYVPSLEEQTAIGRFFHTLDTQISTHQAKLSTLKQLKAAYLQKLLI